MSNPPGPRRDATPGRDALRAVHYNATVSGVRRIHDSLALFQIRPDGALPHPEPGQYLTLGLGDWEPRLDAAPVRASAAGRLVQRPYSLSCPILDEAGRLVTTRDLDYLEFYIGLVATDSDEPPRLTPRLFALSEGARIHVDPKPRGHYLLSPVEEGDDVVLMATGTGEAPHNAMVAQLLARGHRGRIISCLCVRRHRDAAYVEVHRELERRFPDYDYVVLTTREPENVDPRHPEYVGRRYLQDLVGSGELEERVGRLDPAHAHVFLCGNPEMIGIHPHGEEAAETGPRGMVAVLAERGFVLDEPGRPGRVHCESYWG